MASLMGLPASLVLIGYIIGQPETARLALFVLLALLTVNLLMLPTQLYQLMRSRAWLLCPGASQHLLEVAASLLAVWALGLAFATQGSEETLTILVTAIWFWMLASLLVVISNLLPSSFFVLILSFVFFGRFIPEDHLGMPQWLAEPHPVLGLLWAGSGLLTWFWLAAWARQGRVNPARLKQWFGKSFAWLGAIKITGSGFSHFCKVAMLSNRPFIRVFATSLTTLIIVTGLLGLTRHLEGEPPWQWILNPEQAASSPYLVLLLGAAAAALVTTEPLYKKLPRLWLLLDGNREQFYQWLVCAQWGVFVAAFAPLALLGGWLVWQLDAPFLSAFRVVLAWVVTVAFGLYWGNYKIGDDSLRVAVMTLGLITPALLLSVAAAWVIPPATALAALTLLTALVLMVGRAARQRWRTIDWTELRSAQRP